MASFGIRVYSVSDLQNTAKYSFKNSLGDVLRYLKALI